MLEFGSPETHAWGSVDEVDSYLGGVRGISDRTAISLGAFEGFSHVSELFGSSSTLYDMLYEPETRLSVSVYPTGTVHSEEVDEILGSLTRP